MRFEFRQQRLDREEAEKEAKRAARKLAAEKKAQLAAQGSGDAVDPIQAAIDRAKAKKAAQKIAPASAGDELEQLQNKVNSTEKRLETARQKLAQAEAENSDLVAALQTGVDKTTAKLRDAEKALADHQSGPGSATDQATVEEPEDAAQAAIRKAVAARAVQASLSPEEKAKKSLEKLQQRLQKTSDKLAQCRTEGEEEKVIDALSATVERLQGKIIEAEQALIASEDS